MSPSRGPWRRLAGPLLPAAFLFGTLAATSCGWSERSSGAAERTLTILYAGSDDRLFGPSHDDAPKFQLFPPLVSRTGGSCTDPSGPGLAESWEASPDLRRWTGGCGTTYGGTTASR